MISDNSGQSPDLKQDENTTECGAGCNCKKSDISTNIKVAVCVIIAFAATVILLNGFMNKAGAQTNQDQKAFTANLLTGGTAGTESVSEKTSQSENGLAQPAPKLDLTINPPSDGAINLRANRQDQSLSKAQTGVPEPIPGGVSPAKKGQTETALWGEPLNTLATLNTVAMSKNAVFIFLPGKKQTQNDAIKKIIDKAADKAKSRGTVMGAYILNATSQEFLQISKQSPAPCVVVMGKRAGVSVVTGEITVEKLLNALVTASRPTSGCCPSSDPSKSNTNCK